MKAPPSSSVIELDAYGPAEGTGTAGTGTEADTHTRLLDGGRALAHGGGRSEAYTDDDDDEGSGGDGSVGSIYRTSAGRRASVQAHAHAQRRSPLARTAHRIWRPLACVLAPVALLVVYSWVHPHFAGLPPLPHVSITPGSGAGGAGMRPAEMCDCPGPASDGVSSGGMGLQTAEASRICEVYGREGLARSRLFEGSSNRVRRFLHKAQQGGPVKIGILGGSVSACHGVHISDAWPIGDPDGPGCYPSLLRAWLDATFPLADGQAHEIVNGAVGGADSSYYAFCATHHIPKDVDLLILDFDVNDQATVAYETFFDQLSRIVLELPAAPAVLILGMWAPLVAAGQGYGGPGIAHLPIGHYYDVPYVSMKPMLFNHYLRWPQQTTQAFYQQDRLHPNVRGHRILGDILISYLERQMCLVNALGLPAEPPYNPTIATTEPFSSLVEVSFPFNADQVQAATHADERYTAIAHESRRFAGPPGPYAVPVTPLFQHLELVVDPAKPDPDNADYILGLIQPKPFCADANDPVSPMRPASSEGWRKYDWHGEKHYWVSDTPGARIRVDIKVHAGRIAVYYFRSKKYDLGDAKCWVDDNEAGAVRLPGYWDRDVNMASVAYIDELVTPGNHYVTCEVAQDTSHPTNKNAHHFRIVAIMST